jgi:hypothetical protein
VKQFLIKVLAFALCFAVISATLLAATFFLAAPQFRGLYTGAIADKIDRLNSIDEPKIVLVGDSNLAFGIDSALLEEKFDMPVVNLGGHGGLGLEFHLRMAKSNINEGDLVIVANTVYSFPGISDCGLAWISIENLDLYSLIPEDEYYPMVKALPKYAIKTLGHWIFGTGNKPNDNCYSNDVFNEYGDNIFPRPERTIEFTKGSTSVPKINDECARLINDFNAFCEEKGAVCMIAAYPIANGQFTAPAEEYEQFQADLQSKVDCKVISEFTDYFMDYDYFYDTVYHLTDEGAVIRTEKLIADLEKWKQNNEI